MMDQKIFSGVGNILRNEILYRADIHPLTVTGKIPSAKSNRLIHEAAKYAELFYHELEQTKGTALPYINKSMQLMAVQLP